MNDIEIYSKLNHFAADYSKPNKQEGIAASRLAIMLESSPELKRKIADILKDKGVEYVSERSLHGTFCLLIKPYDANNYFIKIEIKLPGIDYSDNAGILPEMLQPLSILYSDEDIHITVVPTIKKLLCDCSKTEIFDGVIGLVNRLYIKGWLFWDPNDMQIGVIEDEKGDKILVIIDPNSVVKVENANEIYYKKEDKPVTYLDAFREFLEKRFSMPPDQVEQIVAKQEPEITSSEQYWAQMVMYERRFPDGINCESRMPLNKQYSALVIIDLPLSAISYK